MRVVAIALVFAVAQDPVESTELALNATPSATEIEFGTAFEITVTRIWSKALTVEAWDDSALEPLVARQLEVSTRETAQRVEETRRFRCYAFTAGEVALSGLWIRARTGDGDQRVALGDEVLLSVAPALPPDAPVAVELPGAPFPAPTRWLLWVAVGAVVVAGVGLWSARRRASGDAGVARAPAHVRALERLSELRAVTPEGFEAVRADAVEASRIVRDYVEERFELHAAGQTTEEFLSGVRAGEAMEPEHRELLADFLDHCDLVKFARHAPDAGDRGPRLDSIETFVTATRPPAENGAE